MPVPWSAQSSRIPRVEDRAITVKQLCDLEVFVQRLCSARLLRSKDGTLTDFFDMSLYDVAELIVRPVIAFVEGQRGTGERYSWVELVAQNTKQEPQLFFSHAWAGRFRDLVAVVKAVARDHGLNRMAGIWLCTFANSQFGEDFGVCLRDSPSHKALQSAPDGVVLVVDRDLHVLRRTWCWMEVHWAMQRLKPLQVYTVSGRVGASVASRRLVDAVDAWDVRRTEASEDADRRQILNVLAGGEMRERDGLETNMDGNFVLLDGWRKQLDGVSVAPSGQMRPRGGQEYLHEAQLFSAHADKFTKRNIAVRSKMQQACNMESHEGRDKGCKLPNLVDRGITLRDLRRFASRAEAWAAEGENAVQWSDLTIQDLHDHYIREPPVTPHLRSFMEEVSSAPKRPQLVFDCAWDARFQDFMSAVEWLVEAQQLPETTTLFFSLVCVNFHEPGSDQRVWEHELASLVRSSDAACVVFPGAAAAQSLRCEVMEQLQLCFDHAIPVYMACPCGVLACAAPFPEGSWERGRFDAGAARALAGARWAELEGQSAEAKARALERVQATQGGMPGFAARMTRLVAGPVLRDAACGGHHESALEVRTIRGCPGFLINSPALRGTFGETAVHVAAATGSLKVLEALLDSHADPNAEDHLRETPLHYAALAGMPDSVKMLRKYGALFGVESSFGEAPAAVAEQHPAAFLGVDTGSAHELLRHWA